MPDLPWRRPARCAKGNCVHVAITATAVHVANTDPGDHAVVTATHDEWAVFVDAVKAGEYDLPAGGAA